MYRVNAAFAARAAVVASGGPAHERPSKRTTKDAVRSPLAPPGRPGAGAPALRGSGLRTGVPGAVRALPMDFGRTACNPF